jgi:UvrD/REP helicase N-terminal domain
MGAACCCTRRVVAGPGSGKTRVLTARIMHLIRQGWAKPSEIMVITFTNKARVTLQAQHRPVRLPRPHVHATVETNCWFGSACPGFYDARAAEGDHNITEVNRTHLVLFGRHNLTFRPLMGDRSEDPIPMTRPVTVLLASTIEMFWDGLCTPLWTGTWGAGTDRCTWTSVPP